MTVTKEDLVNSVTREVRLRRRGRVRQQFLFPEFDYQPLPKKRAARLVETLLELIKKALEKGDSVRIPGFGKFNVKFRWARKGWNPRTGEPTIVDSRRRVTFHCAPRLKEKIRNNRKSDQSQTL